jgi:pimeloyl-ACP methyl ester carboxylesterase
MRSSTKRAGSPNESGRATVDDWQGLGDLMRLATERLTAPVEGMQRVIADRWLGLAGPAAGPIRRMYHSVTAGIYGSVRTTGSIVGTAVGLGAATADGRNVLRPLWRSPVGSGVQAAANGLWGDELERRTSPLSIEMGLRDLDGDPIATNPAALAGAFPHPTTRLVVLVHGLWETERLWQGRREEDGTTVDLGEMLAADACTPLLVRYNTGRHVSDNGAALAVLLEEIVESWPVAVEETALVGHSMGGLVARSSLHAGRTAGHRWVSSARHVVTVGAPHLGAPIEKGTNLLSWALARFPESRPLGEFVDFRSAGIKDLRFGAIREEDWQGADPDALLRDVVGDIPPFRGVEQHFIAGVITADPNHPVGVLVGDLIVRVGSGTGRSHRRRIEATNVRVFGGRRHFDLLHDAVVHDQVRSWLAAQVSDPTD